MPTTDALQTQDVHVAGTQRLIAPAELKASVPLPREAAARTVEHRNTIARILTGEDRRMLAIVGPCSIHDREAALDYAERLARLREEVGDQLEILMRVYFEKPRTTLGWKGLINDPHLDGSFDMDTGLKIARQLLVEINDLGLPAATEMLDPFTPQYIDDAVAWAAIGARTTESQTHRQMASGLSMPVGYKNATNGDLEGAINAMKSARNPHRFLGVDDDGRACIVSTTGNPLGHLILRGGTNRPNYDPANVAHARDTLSEAGLSTALMVDCSHANSNKQPQRQEVVWDSVIDQRVNGAPSLVGLMLESHLHEGAQKLGDDPAQLAYGVSITDPCTGWEKTEQLLRRAAEKLA
jgi:3-deoxy-7-phosphoheptulonate synthase